MTDHAPDIVFELARANPQWATQRGAEGKCYEASSRLSMTIFGSRLITADCGIGDHVAVILPNDQVIDLTIRQFDPTATYPWIDSRIEWCDTMVEHFKRATFFRIE